MKYYESTKETDVFAYGTESDRNSGCYHTGWYIYLPSSRRKEIASFLGLDSIYCVGINNHNKKIIVQTSRRIDERNGSLEYVVVKDEHFDYLSSLITKPFTEAESQESAEEDEKKMELARRGVL